MSKETVDSYDYCILGLLQENASLSATAIAESVNLSLNACWRRIRRLETDGYIVKGVTLLDPGLLGSPTVVFVMIRTSEHSTEWLEKFASVAQGIPEIMEIYRLSGEVDYLMKIRVSDISAYDQVYKRLIAGIKLTDVSSSFAMERIKFTTSIPLPAH
jgi:Lrp/AsnC family transcriptional regulator